MSDTEVRDEGNKLIVITDLIVHHSIMDVLNQTVNFVCIVDVVEKTLCFSLLLQWLKLSQNIPQCPDDLCLLNLTFDHVEYDITIPVPFSLLFLQHHLQEQVYRSGQKWP